ncbi:MAG: WG repeat-containing protein [Zoogloeaceae bacterium]|jgi:hypothetical protein|nr:WG repeat-containing protein [Zoogloeaceae bacterium]
MTLYDAFICHATEDKEDLVRPLVKGLADAGYKIWVDESAIDAGDGFRRSIDCGLIASRCGIPILSPSFYAKEWPQRELDAMLSMEIAGNFKIIPIWHGVTRTVVMEKSPLLVDKLALRTADMTIDEMVASLARVLNPDIPPDAGKRIVDTLRPEAPGTPVQPQPDAPQGEWEWAIPPRYHNAQDFANGLAAVQMKSDKWGYINAKGEFVIQPNFDSAGDFAANGLAAVKVEGKYGYINAEGELIIRPNFDRAKDFAANGLAAVEVGYINAKGELIIRPTFDNAWTFAANGLAAVKVERKWGYINAEGEFIIQPNFDLAREFAANGLAQVEVENKYGYINAEGEFIISPEFNWVRDFGTNGVRREAWSSRLPWFNRVRDFGANGLAAAKGEGQWGYIRYRGKWKASPSLR